LRRACAEAKLWPDVKVAINVSPIQFRQKDFVATVNRILTESGTDAQRVELELTEGVVIADADLAEHAMVDLRALGVRMVLDDFGTGYSSLIYLRRFAFDKIKIDRSFMESMEFSGESAIIIRSIVDLGRSLGLTVTAEGVETEEQARFLRTLGCDELQGYLFGRPVTATEIEQRLAEQRAEQMPPEALRFIA
jgi:EAL domain-containing protein (putative c-di-GMP-specific phosphodiesterase class I)